MQVGDIITFTKDIKVHSGDGKGATLKKGADYILCAIEFSSIIIAPKGLPYHMMRVSKYNAKYCY